MALQQVPGIQRRKIGDTLVTALNDGHIMLPVEAMTGVSAEESDALYRAAGRRPPYATAINAYLVQTPDQTVLIDAGSGRYMGPLLGRVRTNLAHAGVSPEDVDVVALTHMHSDHVGGLLKDDDSPAYPNARILVAADELRYWANVANLASSPEATRDAFDLARKLTSTYRHRIETFEGSPEIVSGLVATPLPGHTPGHTGYSVGHGRTELLVWGDICHAPELQLRRPELCVIFDVDPAQAATTRHAVMKRAVDEDLGVAGMHIPFPGFVRLARSGDAYAFYPQVVQYELA